MIIKKYRQDHSLWWHFALRTSQHTAGVTDTALRYHWIVCRTTPGRRDGAAASGWVIRSRKEELRKLMNLENKTCSKSSLQIGLKEKQITLWPKAKFWISN